MLSKARREASAWLKTGLLLLPLVMGIALVGGALSNRQRTHGASQLLIQAQAHSFVRALASNLRHAPPLERDQLLDEMLEEFRDDGLRLLALVNKDGTLDAKAGQGKIEKAHALLARSTPFRIDEHRERVHVSARLPQRRSRRALHRFGTRRGQRPNLAQLHLQFEPTLALRLQRDADQAFLLSSITAIALMSLAAALWWQLRRREALAATVEREGHLAQLGEMSAVLAHEMRNPLASLKGHAQLLLEQLAPGSRESKKAERIVSEAGRLETLSSTLLDFVRSGTIERRPVDIASLIQQTVDEFESGHIHVETRGRLERKVSLDPVRMRQVLVNLLQNALEASSAEASVEVKLEVGTRDFQVSVRDHGPGLPPEADKRIFEAFHTDKTYGTGLGLAIARRIVEMHEGTLTAQNHPEGGALFVLEAKG